MAIVEWLFAHFVGCEASGKKVLLAAAKGGHLRVFRFLWERRSGARDGSGQAAASQEGNNLAPSPCTIQVKDTYNVERWRRFLIERATENGQLIDCLRDGMQLQDYERYYAISHALALGNCKLAELLLPDGDVLLYYAPWCPPPELVEAMVKMEHFWWNEDRAMDVVAGLAAKGSLELMQQLFQRFSPLKEDQACWQRTWRDAMEAACTHGHLLVLQWLMNHPLGRAQAFTCEKRGCVCSRLVECATTNGHVDILQYMLEQGVFEEASKDGYMIDRICECHIDSVQWLADHDLIGGQQLFSYAIARAALYGRLDILRLFQALDAAEEDGVVGTKRKRTGRQFSIWGGNRDTFYWAAKGGHVAVLDWLQRNYPAHCEADAMDIAASRGHLDAVKWLHSNRTEGCTIDAMYLAARNGHFEVVKWLYVNRPESHSIAGIAKAVQYGRTLAQQEVS